MKELEIHAVAELGFQSLCDDTQLARNEHLISYFPFTCSRIFLLPTFTRSFLWVYNLGIHIVGNGNGYMCTWPENIAQMKLHHTY